MDQSQRMSDALKGLPGRRPFRDWPLKAGGLLPSMHRQGAEVLTNFLLRVKGALI